MREEIGKWNFAAYSVFKFFAEDGVFRREFDIHDRDYSHHEEIKFKRALGQRYFCDSEFLVGVPSYNISEFLFDANGKTEEEVASLAREWVDRRAERKEVEDAKRDKWQRLKDRFGGAVIGLGSKIDVYGAGFSVRALLNSEMSFSDRKRFVADNRVDILRWVIHEVSESKGILRRIGDVRFYKPVEMTVLRSGEVEVKFGVKRDIKSTA